MFVNGSVSHDARCHSDTDICSIWFGIITKQAIRRGDFTSVRQLINTINAYIANWNHDSQPFTWTATTNEIITKVLLAHQDFQKLLDNNKNSQ